MRHAVRAFAGRCPRAATWAGALLGACTQRLGRGLDEPALRRFFPDASAAQVRRLQRATWSRCVRLRMLDAGGRSVGARWPYPGLARGTRLPRIEGPAILASIHVGPIPAVGMLLERISAHVLVLHVGWSPRPGLEVVAVGTDDWSRAAAFRRAVDVLRGGGVVFLMVDANVFPATVDATLFGRRVEFARGAFALARLTGAPVVPVATRWVRDRVEIVSGAPIAAGTEREVAAATAEWFEAFVRASPAEIGPQFVSSFWGDAPPGDPTTSGGAVRGAA